MNNQKILLEIVKRWKVNLHPEYRGFRCADCQRYIHKAWHHQLKSGGYNTPVHFCHKCQKNFGSFDGLGYKIFSCDKCGRNLYKAFHVWTKQGKILVETHYCKSCWENMLA